jgi:hypothetical protein
VAAFAQAYVESVQAAEATDHVGRKNRLARHRSQIVQELTPRPILDFPPPFSHAVSKLDLNEHERRSYFDVWLEIRHHRIPQDCVRYASFSELRRRALADRGGDDTDAAAR